MKRGKAKDWVVTLGANEVCTGTKKECVRFYLKHYKQEGPYRTEYRLYSRRALDMVVERANARAEALWGDYDWRHEMGD